MKQAIMLRVAEGPRPATPRGDAAFLGALGLVIFGLWIALAPLLGGDGGGTWEWRLDTSLWLELLLGAVGPWVAVALGHLAEWAEQYAQMLYWNLLDSLPMLAAATLLAIFALGPAELARAFSFQARR